MKSKKAVVIAVLVLCLAASAYAKNFTLQEVLSAPFPSDLVVSPGGDRVAWVFNSEGKRNIWTAEVPDYSASRVTSFDRDDGQELGSLVFSPDGAILVYVYGGSRNRQGEHPNPMSDPGGTEQAVWAVKVSGGKAWKLGLGSAPVVSPRGDRVVFSSRGQLVSAPLDGSAKAESLFDARGNNRSAVFSPDGSKIAFVSSREDHSFIGIFDLEKKAISWMNPSVDRDTEPVWSTDGNRIAFFRFPGEMVEPARRWGAGTPFSIRVADVNSGKGRCVWTCPDSSGGFAQSYPAHPLMWGADDRLAFYSEHDGWMHLWSVSVNGGQAICLTPGEYEVEDCARSPDGRSLVFNSNRADIDRRHLWEADIAGGGLKRLTEGEGLEWAPVITNAGTELVFLCSTWSRPAAPAVMPGSGGRMRLLAGGAIPDGFPIDRLQKPQQVIFQSPDGFDIHGQLFVPSGIKRGDRRPAVIFMHGGPIRQMMLGWHMRGYYHRCYGMNQYLAGQGYVVLSVNFRSGIGYGRRFRTVPDQGPRGASEYQDIIAAAKFLQDLREVDQRKIGLWGGSYGGYLTAMGLARDSDLFAAGVDLHGVHDWSLRGRRRNGGGWGIQGEDVMRQAWASSPVADVAFWTSPVLFVHGDDDRNVDFIQTTDLVQRLRREGKAHVEMLIFPDEVHGFLRHDRWLETFEAAADFFDRFLKN